MKNEEAGKKRRPWTGKEDAAIRGLVSENGVKQWTLIAENLCKLFNIVGRTGKQCRERWHNHLSAGITKQPWSLEEELTLFDMHEKIGNKWAEVAKNIPGRTDNSIKNHFYSTIRKYYRKLYGQEGTVDDLKLNLKQITENILESLQFERQNLNNDEQMTSDTLDDTQLFPDFSDMIITGQHIEIPQDWCPQDYCFSEDQEVLFFPSSPYENLDFFNSIYA